VAPRPGSAAAAAEHAAAAAAAAAAGAPPPPPPPPPGSATVLLRRCRYLEASGCKSECVNVCKVPTQAFFAQHIGIPLTMRPHFEDRSCELIFGAAPPPLAEDEAFRGACFPDCSRAPAREAARGGTASSEAAAAAAAGGGCSSASCASACHLMPRGR
jgi:hypothetical protein